MTQALTEGRKESLHNKKYSLVIKFRMTLGFCRYLMFEIQENIFIRASAHAGIVYTNLTLQEFPVWLHFMHVSALQLSF